MAIRTEPHLKGAKLALAKDTFSQKYSSGFFKEFLSFVNTQLKYFFCKNFPHLHCTGATSGFSQCFVLLHYVSELGLVQLEQGEKSLSLHCKGPATEQC